jgi:hypothetical protein
MDAPRSSAVCRSGVRTTYAPLMPTAELLLPTRVRQFVEAPLQFRVFSIVFR